MAEQFILGVDLDGVVGAYTRRFREICVEITGRPSSDFPMERDWAFSQWNLEDGEYEELHNAAVLRHGLFSTMPVMENAANALWRLSDAGIWIRIVTHRLYLNWGHGTVVGDTAEWLDRHSIPYRDLCFLGAKPQVQADAYIDDAPHNISALRDSGNTVITFDQPYNRGIDGLRAKNWLDVEEIVKDLALEHTGSFEAQLPGMESGSDRLAVRKNEQWLKNVSMGGGPVSSSDEDDDEEWDPDDDVF